MSAASAVSTFKLNKISFEKHDTLPMNALKRSLRGMKQTKGYNKESMYDAVIDAKKAGKIKRSQFFTKDKSKYDKLQKLRNRSSLSTSPEQRNKKQSTKYDGDQSKKDNISITSSKKSVSQINRSVRLVINFKELLKTKVALTADRWLTLRKIFKLIDADHSGCISHDEVVKFNIFVDPMANLKQVDEDVKLLFDLADYDKNGYITEIEYLQGWTDSVEIYKSFHHIDAFLESFRSVTRERNIEGAHIKQASKFSWITLAFVLRWKNRAIQVVRNRHKYKTSD